MATTLVLAVAFAAFAQQRERVAVDPMVHVHRILEGTVEERRASVRALAALDEGEASSSVRVLMAAPHLAREARAFHGYCHSSCGGHDRIWLPSPATYIEPPRWLESTEGPHQSCLQGIDDIDTDTDPRTIACWLVANWSPGTSLVTELRLLVERSQPPGLRAQAIRALGSRGDPRAASCLGPLLGETDVGWHAAWSLARLGPDADAHAVAAIRTRRENAEGNALWYLAQHPTRIPVQVLVEIADRLEGGHHAAALTVLVRAGPRAEGPLLQQVARGGVVAERAVAGLTLLPGRTGPVFATLLALTRDTRAGRRSRALALAFLGESPQGVALLAEFVRLAQEPGDLLVRTAAARALGGFPDGKSVACDAALQIVASDVPGNVRIAALRSAVQLDPSAEMRRRVDLLHRERKVPSALRDEAASLLRFTDWRDP